MVMKNWRSRKVLKTELPRNVGIINGRYQPTMWNCLYMVKSGISVAKNGIKRVPTITWNKTSRPLQRMREKP